MKRLLILAGLLIATCTVHAESRDPNSPTTPERLKEMSSLVFEGTVVEIETNAQYKVAFPAKAAVANVLKGKLETKELTFKHKHPGKFIILEKEYNAPQFGQSGTFYIEDHGGTLVLIGYIKETEQPSAGDALKGAPQIVRPITVTNCCAVAERSDALTFVTADNKTFELESSWYTEDMSEILVLSTKNYDSGKITHNMPIRKVLIDSLQEYMTSKVTPAQLKTLYNRGQADYTALSKEEKIILGVKGYIESLKRIEEQASE